MCSPLFVVTDLADKSFAVDTSDYDRPVIRIRRGQVVTPEFAQALSDALSTRKVLPDQRNAGRTARPAAGATVDRGIASGREAATAPESQA